MNRTVKWGLIIGGSLVVLLVAALVLLPRFMDISRYKPRIEAQVAKFTGRTFRVGDDLRLSLFPYAGISFSDLHLGSLPGFEEKDFIFVKSFEVRVKLLPLLIRDVQVKRFILKGARIVLETDKDGRINWKFNSKTGPEDPPETPREIKAPETFESGDGVDLKAFALGELAVTDGSVIWVDHTKKTRKEISDVTLLLHNVSLERPVDLSFSARLDKQPFSIKGNVGPIGKMPGQGTIPLDLSVSALERVDIGVKGHVTDPAARVKFDINVDVSPFSPRKLLAAIGETFPVSTSDSKAIHRASFNADLKGDAKNISISNGALDMDESKVTFKIQAGDFSRPRVTFEVAVDRIDADRYLPSTGGKEAVRKETVRNEGVRKEGVRKETVADAPEAVKRIDYSPLRRLALNGTVRIEKLKIKNAEIERVHLKMTGEKGVFKLQPLTMALYQGDLSGNGVISVEQDVPRTHIQLELNGVQAGRLLGDVLKKDFLEGSLKAKIDLSMKGDDAAVIKNTLSGGGDLLFKDGAIKGIDLEGMVHNVKTAFGLAEKGEKTPRTDFSELHAPFSLKNGIFNTTDTTLVSPLIRLKASGDADLVKEQVDFRLEPKLVATLKGQGDIKIRSGIIVPVVVSGTFSSLKFRPDLEGMLKQEIRKSLPDLQKRLKGGESSMEGSESVEDQIKGILKRFGN
jgi:AsmA protein